MSHIQRKYLRELSFDTTNPLIIGLIIGKSEMRIFQSKNSTDYRGVITFTVRDTRRHFTNCKCWGSRLRIEEYDKMFQIYDIINIISPKIIPISSPSGKNNNQNNSFDEQFQPLTSTPFLLVINEGSGSIEHYYTDSRWGAAGGGGGGEVVGGGVTADGDAILFEFQNLINQPLKPLENKLNLADLNVNGINNVGKYVNLLLIIKYFKPLRSVRMKTGETKECLELIVMDESYSKGILLTLWHRNWIKRAMEHWKVFSTILHLIDVRVNYSTFYKATTLALSGRTIISEDPEGNQADALMCYVNSLSQSEKLTMGFYDLPKLETITNIMTVQQIYDRAEGDFAERDTCEEFSAILYAMVTKFDLDGYGRLIGKKCKFCKRQISSTKNYCETEQCQLNLSLFHRNEEKFNYYFDINLNLTDHTGTLIEGKLTDQIAEKILNCSIDEFRQLTDAEKTELKWKFLMERFAIKLVVKKKSIFRRNMIVILLDFKEIHINDIAKNILVY